MKMSVSSNTQKRKAQSTTTAVSQCLPSKKSSLIYKSIYLNLLEKTKSEALDQPNLERLKENREKQAVQPAISRHRNQGSQLMRASGTNSNLLGLPDSGLFTRNHDKNVFAENLLGMHTQQS